jgi:hypothetical protein
MKTDKIEISWLRIMTYFIFATFILSVGIWYLTHGVYYDQDVGNRYTKGDPVFWLGLISTIIFGGYALILFIKNTYLKIKEIRNK